MKIRPGRLRVRTVLRHWRSLVMVSVALAALGAMVPSVAHAAAACSDPSTIVYDHVAGITVTAGQGTFDSASPDYGVFSHSFSLHITCDGQPLQGAVFELKARAKTLTDLYATINGDAPVPGTGVLLDTSLQTSIGTVASDVNGIAAFTLKVKSQGTVDLTRLGTPFNQIGTHFDVLVQAPDGSGTLSDVTDYGYGSSGPIFAATPEASSLELGATGLLAGLGILFYRRRRAKRSSATAEAQA